jgi:hypothetical protein
MKCNIKAADIASGSWTGTKLRQPAQTLALPADFSISFS